MLFCFSRHFQNISFFFYFLLLFFPTPLRFKLAGAAGAILASPYFAGHSSLVVMVPNSFSSRKKRKKKKKRKEKKLKKEIEVLTFILCDPNCV